MNGHEGEAMTITDFLLARIAEDEAAARAAIAVYAPDAWDNPASGGNYYPEDIAFWERMTPARVLAECAAKLAIVEMHSPDRHLENWYWSQRKCAECGGTWHRWINNDVPTDIGPEQGCPTLRALTAVYADHPDYRLEWPIDTP